MDSRDEFLEIYYDKIERDGADRLLEWLEKSDFFTAPASTKRHNSFKGGLCAHSINVYKRLLLLVEQQFGNNWKEKISEESLAIMGLLHDICKVDTYKEDIFTVTANIAGLPSLSIPFGKGENNLPFGVQLMAKKFDEKSIYKLAKFIESSLGE